MARSRQFSGANPDLEVAFDFVRYARPQVPANLAGADLSNPAAVSDAQLLAFLGKTAHEPATPLRLQPAEVGAGIPRLRIAYANDEAVEAHRFDRVRIRATTTVGAPAATWRALSGAVQSDAEGAFVEDAGGAVAASQFYFATELP